MNASNKIIYNVADFSSKDDFFEAVCKQFRLLVENHNVITFHENPKIKGMYALQFGPSEVSASESYPIWLTGDEIMYVTAYASHNKYVESKQYVQDYEEDEDNFEDMIKDPGDKKSDA